MNTFFIGRYQVLSQIGQGGMGKVYKVKDGQLNRILAIKQLITTSSTTRTDVERFLQEARASAKLTHPNITRVYDIGQEKDSYYFVMDFISGKSLSQMIKSNHNWSSRQIAQIMIEITTAIHYAHTEGIIHRDIKPANIMMENEKMPKVTDFGLAKVIEDDKQLSRTGTVLGTVQYMPPEQAEGKIHEIDACSDVYSLGAILYELLTGRPPFTGNSFVKIVVQIVEKNPIKPSLIKRNIPQPLEIICLKALAKQKKNRYPSAQALADDLQRFLDKQTISARPSYFKEFLKKSYLYILVCVLLLLLITGIWAGKKLAPWLKTYTAEKYLQITLVDKEGKAQQDFVQGQAIRVQIRWQQVHDFPTLDLIELYGENMQYKAFQAAFQAAFQTAGQNELQIPIPETTEKGHFKLIVKCSSGKKSKVRIIPFTIKELPKEPSKTYYSSLLQQNVPQKDKASYKFIKTNIAIASPLTISNDILYFIDITGHLYAFNLKKRKTLWKSTVKGLKPYKPALYKNSIFVPSKDALYALNTNGQLLKTFNITTRALNLAKNKLFVISSNIFYHIDTDKLTTSPEYSMQLAQSPTLLGKIIYAPAQDKSLYAIDADRKSKSLFSAKYPFLTQATVNKQYLAIADAGGYLYLANTLGELKWQLQLPDMPLSSPVIHKTTVFYCGNSHIYAFDIETTRVLWQYKLQERSEIFENIVQQMFILKNNLYICIKKQRIIALNIATGRCTWLSQKIKPAAMTIGKDGKLYISQNHGEVVIIEASKNGA